LAAAYECILPMITTGLVSSIQDPIGTSGWNHPHKRGQKTPKKPTAPTRKLWSDYRVVHRRPKTPKTAKIRLFDRNLREEKLSFHPDQPSGGNFLLNAPFSENLHRKLRRADEKTTSGIIFFSI